MASSVVVTTPTVQSSDLFGSGGTADGSVPNSNWPTNRASDFNLTQSGLLTGQSQASAIGNRLYRGYLRSVASTASDQSYIFNFHYNPTEINFAYDFNEDQLTAEALGTEQSSVPNLVGGASVSFTMRLDRTQEMAAISQGADSPGNLGVLHDLRVLQKLVGALDSGSDGKTNGQIVSVPVNVVFSNQLGNPVAPTEATLTSTGLNFRGYITGMQVTFTQFNYLMVPNRADVDVVVRKVFEPNPNADPNLNKPGTQPGFSSGGLGRSYSGATS